MKYKEVFFQNLLEKILGGTHLHIPFIGITDITTTEFHAEIKNWKGRHNVLGQLLSYNSNEPRNELRCYLFGKKPSDVKVKNLLASIDACRYNIKVYSLDVINNNNTLVIENLKTFEKLEYTISNKDKIKYYHSDSDDNNDGNDDGNNNTSIVNDIVKDVVNEIFKNVAIKNSNNNVGTKTFIDSRNEKGNFVCRRCGYETLYKHSLAFHLQKKNICNIVNEDIDRDTLLENLYKKYADLGSRFTCSYCNSSFSQKNNMYAHQKICLKIQKIKMAEELKKKIYEQRNNK